MQSISAEILLIQIVVLVLSLSFHEAAHAWAADRLGDPTARLLGRLTLNPLAHIDWIGTVLFPLVAIYYQLPLIGWAKPVPVNSLNLRAPRRDFAMVALAGPVSNIVLAVGAAILLGLVPGARDGAATGTIPVALLTWTVVINILLAVFNMMPVPPLDGGNVVAGFVPEAVAHLIDQIRPYGFILLYGLLLTGVLFQIIYPIYTAILRWLLF